MTEAFFTATKKALNNITSMYDSVWPIAVGLWNLRCLVNGVKKEYPNITEPELAAKFSVGSGIHGVNYRRAFFEQTWEEQQTRFAWILLNSTIPIFEGWLEELKATHFPNMNVKDLQYPKRVRKEVSRLTRKRSLVLENAFYSAYQRKRDRCYVQIETLLKCYRVFKEARNCYMHNGLKANANLVDAYKEYSKSATPASLGVSEIPEFFTPVLDNNVKLSLRGVVGFSYIVIKILVSIDAELLCSSDAEDEFLSRYRQKHTILRTLKPNLAGARSQVEQYVRQCGFVTPQAVDDVMNLLITHGLLRKAPGSV